MLILFPLAAGSASAQKGSVPVLDGLGRSNQAPLDLPAMTIRPADLSDEGMGNFGQSYGVLTNDAREAGEFVAYSEIDPESDDVTAYVEAGAQRYYIQEIDDSFYDDENEGVFYNIKVVGLILEYDTADDAGNGLDAMWHVWSSSDTLLEERLTQKIGDDAFYLEGEGIDNYSGLPTERTLLVFQRDTIVAGILTYNSNSDGAFSQDINEALGNTVLQRVEAGLAGNHPGLGSTIVRLDVPAIGSFYDTYGTIAGEIICTSEVLVASECESFQDLVDDFNEVDRYNLMVNIATDNDDASSFVSVSLRTFEDEESAEARFDELSESRTTNITDLGDLDFGDESIRWSEDLETVTSETVLVRSGDTIFEISQRATYAIDPEGLQELAGLQVSCIEGNASCTEPVAIPTSMLPPGNR